jgi:hypothetical protein
MLQAPLGRRVSPLRTDRLCQPAQDLVFDVSGLRRRAGPGGDDQRHERHQQRYDG